MSNRPHPLQHIVGYSEVLVIRYLGYRSNLSLTFSLLLAELIFQVSKEVNNCLVTCNYNRSKLHSQTTNSQTSMSVSDSVNDHMSTTVLGKRGYENYTNNFQSISVKIFWYKTSFFWYSLNDFMKR